MSAQLKRAFFRMSKALGLFHLSRLLTRRGLRILCYHGFSADDEAAFRPLLFISPETFERRLRLLARGNFPVLDLAEAIERQGKGELPAGATVITIDDGLTSVYRRAFPLLQRYRMPATLYLTTYYHQKQTPVFRLAVSYLLWKSTRPQADFTGLGVPALEGAGELPLTADEKVRLSQVIAEHGDRHCDNEARLTLCRALAERLGVDFERILADRVFHIVSPAELKDMSDGGMSIELHTHRHEFLEDPEPARREIQENRAIIEPVVGRPLRHFCYPSGEWSRCHWPILQSEGIESATTVEPGLVFRETPRFALGRVLDSEEVSDIEFEAEVYGYAELIRQVRGSLRLGFRARREGVA